MVQITFGSGVEFAGTARGATIVIDTFRAFTTAAVLFDAGVDRLVLTASLDDAQLWKARGARDNERVIRSRRGTWNVKR